MIAILNRYELGNRAIQYANEFGLDLVRDIRKLKDHSTEVRVSIATDDKHRIVTHHYDNAGVDYYSTRFDFKSPNIPLASRVMACIMPGNRTWFSYRPLSNDAQKLLVHQGNGYLIIGDPLEAELNLGLGSQIYPLNAQITSKISIPAGRFYCLEAASWSKVPFVISGMSAVHKNGEWDKPEVTFMPGDAEVITPDGVLLIPDDFVSANFS